MKLFYYELENDNLTEYQKKKLNIMVFKPKDFDDYRKEIEDDGGKVEVIKNTRLAKYKEDEEHPEEDDDYIEIQGHKFKLMEEKARAAKFYIPVGEFEFVRVESWLMLWIFFFILLVGILLGLLCAIPKTPEDKPYDPVKVAQSQDITDKKDEDLATSSASEYTEFPGYAHIKIKKEQPYVYLTNPEGNTVYMAYSIYQDDVLIYETDGAIAPGQEIKADLYSLLDAGQYNLKFIQSTYDIETSAPCNGTKQDVDITVE